MTYEEALNYIHSISWTFTKPGLERIGELCKRLGDPQNHLRFIHVAGTNGKGSFCSMLESVLRASGMKTGLFTSPYIRKFNERIRVCGKDIAAEDLAEITEYIKPFADGMKDKPTEFELITAIGLEYFRRQKCEVVILEAGMGGRLDSTNVIPSSLLSVITGISLDHTAYLGNTVSEIAAEKAGIIKHGGTVLFCGNSEDAKNVIDKKADEMSARLITPDRSTFKLNRSDLNGSSFDFGVWKDVEIELLGLYQPENASNVLCAIEILRELGMNIPDDAVREGLKSARWQARFELLSRDPVVIFDGAHNPEGIDAAVRTVKHYFPSNNVCILSGVMKDKDYEYIATRLSSIARRAFTVTPDNPRALNAQEYASVLSRHGIRAAAYESVRDALTDARLNAAQSNTPLICLGSLYMYEEIFDLI